MNDTYHNDFSSESNSSLSLFRESPRKYYEMRIAKTRQPEPMSPALELGIAFHAMILQPDLILNNYAIGGMHTPTISSVILNTQARKFISGADAERLVSMAWSLCQNTKSVSLLDWSRGDVEKPFYATDPETGIKIKCRPDLLTKDGIMPDIKTTAPKRKKHPCSPEEFSKTIYEYGYHRQVAFYKHILRLNGIDDVKHVFIAVSSAEPWGCAVYELDHESISIGHDENMETLRELAERRAANNWEENWAAKVNTIGIPYWAKRR